MPNGLNANDSSAELGAGGLVFTISRDIEMISEDLFLSENEIIVNYKFLNRSSRDVTSLVAFPLPDIVAGDDGDLVPPYTDAVNFVDFETLVDGQRISADVELKAGLQGIDKTAFLNALGIPHNPRSAGDVIARAKEGIIDQLRKENLIDENNNPLWSLKTTFYWKQIFPAGHTIQIKHRYKPITGGSALTGIHMAGNDFYKKYCPEPSLIAAVKNSIGSGEEYPRFSETNIEYILTTGANWANPIKNFRLVVDKGSAQNLVSFCGEGVKKIGPTQFELSARDFTPKENLHVVILSPTDTRVYDNSEADDLGDASCEALWIKRNSIFKKAGYCFKTPKAIAKFGNAGCKHDNISDVTLAEDDKNAIVRINREERTKNCRQ